MTRVPRSKTAVPELPPDFLPRPTLVAALDDGEDSALTLVCAPPGYGKTLLLADWARSRDVACAWVALDEDDDDPRQLWDSVLAALLAACPDLPPSHRLRSLVVPRTSVGVDFLTDVVSALGSVPTRVRLVLDDAHHLRGAAALHGLQVLLRTRLDNVRLVLASRSDPPLPVARLRLEDRLCELRTAELSFSVEETACLADRCGLDLTEDQSAVLHSRTEGWAAGIRLAALPLRDHPDPHAFLQEFSGDERPVADYLADEVFSAISSDERDLLRRASICDPLPTPLAAALSGRADAADVLAALERRTGLVVATGAHRTEFRFQELMRSYLTADLHRHGPALAAQLHGTAAEWWSAAGRPIPALRHAAQAADGALFTDLLHQWAAELVARGEHTELRRALATAGPGHAATDPWLPLISAQVHLGMGELAAARADVARARAVRYGPDDADLASFRTATAQLAGAEQSVPDDLPLPLEPALAALASAGRCAARLLPTGTVTPSEAALVFGDLEAALAAARDGRWGLLELQCLCLVGSAALSTGDQRRAAAAASAAITTAAAHGWADSHWTAAAHAVLAHASLTQACPERALQIADGGLAMAAAVQDPVLRFALRCARGGALCDVGDQPAGLRELQQAHAELGGTAVPAQLAASATLLEYRAALLLGFPAAAATSMGRLAARGDAVAEVFLMRAWSEAAAGSARLARATVAPLLAGNVPTVLRTTLIEALLVEAWGAQRSGDRPAGRAALQEALASAEPMDVVRPFAIAGHGVRVLLVDQLGGVRDPVSFAFRCLAGGRPVHEPLAAQLSGRERDVLSQLISLSNLGEIAEDLEVSVNTVKSHVRAIYGKLGVSTRRTAVLTAVECGLLA